LWLDATYLKQREGGRIVAVAAIIAVWDYWSWPSNSAMSAKLRGIGKPRPSH